jgi:branched-chain amino acid transport system permease protein
LAQDRLQRWAPYALTPLVVLAALPAMGVGPWVTLTVAGLTMGIMLFLVASGLTLIFGLMDVLNFAHAAFVTVGAYVAVSVLRPLAGWTTELSLTLNLARCLWRSCRPPPPAARSAFVFERVIIRQVYGAPLRQILITIGALTVIEQLDDRAVGPQAHPAAQAGHAARQRVSSALRRSKPTACSRFASGWPSPSPCISF